jgi:tRNA 2-selenouridine synthase
MRDDGADYRALFLDNLPLMDVRAPAEFHKGAFPGAVNLPLMNDIERQKVGACYKQNGQQAALDLGYHLVSGKIRADRLEAWSTFVRAYPQGYLYCFRGGLRSQIVQQWLAESGMDFPRVIGGYKAMRAFLIGTIEAAVSECNFVLVGGFTGTGKTDVLTQLDNAIDLEGHANHRGSGFGKHATPQPSQIDFENYLAIDFLKQRANGAGQFSIEDEGRAVGCCSVPPSIYQRMQESPLVWLEDGFDERVERILGDYVVGLCDEFVALHGGELGMAEFAKRMRQCLFSIAKRLGGECYSRLSVLMDNALEEQARSGTVNMHRTWIEGLLREYYDPMYSFQLERKNSRIVFSGEQRAVVDYLRQHTERKND